MANTVIYQKRGADKVKVAETPDLSPYAIKADVDAELATKADAEDLDITDKRVDNVLALLNGALSVQQTDSTSAYSKSVPAKAQPYAAINAIGGKTVVWNQLNKQNAATQTKNNITFTNNGNGTWTITGTPSAGAYIYTGDGISIIYGHKYIIATSGEPSGVETDCAWYAGSTYVGQVLSNTIVTPPDSTVDGMTCCKIGINSTLVGTALNFTMKTTFIDLTLLYGAGNEPATVAEFAAMFPSINPAYNAGTLKSAGVTGVVSRGVNYIPMPKSLTPATSDYGITITPHSDGSYTLSGTAIAGHNFCVELETPFVIPENSYTHLRNDAINTSVTFILQNASRVSITSPSLNTLSRISEMPSSAYGETAVYLGIYVANGVTLNNITIRPSIELVSTATDFTPYRAPITLPIPAAVQSLPGYGWSAGFGAGEAYSMVDLKNKKFVCPVTEYVLKGTEPWAWQSNNGLAYLTAPGMIITDAVTQYNIYVICDNTEITPSSWVNRSTPTLAMGSIYGGAYLYLKGASITSAADAVAYFTAHPTTVRYVLNTPTETDISQYITDDNLLAVEPGGTVSFPSVLGDDYRLPVPSDVEYTIDLAPDTPSTDGTYTLQCVVSDGVATYSWVSA